MTAMRPPSPTPTSMTNDVLVFKNEIFSSKSMFSSWSTTSPTATELKSKHGFWKGTAQDLKTIRWRHLLRHILIHLTPLAILGVLIWLIVAVSTPWEFAYTGCTPDGRYEVIDGDYSSYNPWQQNSLFGINIGFGQMSFAAAKGVDIVWDIGFGRGGQGVLCLVAYRVYTKSLSRIMETQPVTQRTFEAITLQSVTLTELFKLGRDLVRHSTIRAKLVIVWIIVSTSFLLSFQSIASAMTGYSAVVSAFIQNNEGERVPADQFEAVQYIVHDADRLGSAFAKDYPAILPAYGDPNVMSYQVNMYQYYFENASRTARYSLYNYCASFQPLMFNFSTEEASFSWKGEQSYISDLGLDSCNFMWHVSEYAATYGFLGLNDTNSTFNNSGTIVTLEAPSLNISAYFGNRYSVPDGAPWSAIPYGYYWKDPSGEHPFQKSAALFAYGDTTYNVSQLQSQGTCQQVDLFDIKYQWGYSSILLAIFAALMIIWTIGTYSMYMDSHLNSTLDASHRHISLRRAVLDLQAAMKKDLIAENVQDLSDAELQQLVKNGDISYVGLPTSSLITRRARIGEWWHDFRVGSWARREKWWLLALFFFTIMLPISWTTSAYRWWSPIFSPLPWAGVLIVLIIGRKHQSRWIWFTVLFALFWGGNVLDILASNR